MMEVGKHRQKKTPWTVDYVGQSIPFTAVQVSYDGVLFMHHYRRYPYTGGAVYGHTEFNIDQSWRAAQTRDMNGSSIVTQLSDPDADYYDSYKEEVSKLRANRLVGVMNHVGWAWVIRDDSSRKPSQGKLCIDFEHRCSKETVQWLYNRFISWPLHGYEIEPACAPLWSMLRLTETTN